MPSKLYTLDPPSIASMSKPLEHWQAGAYLAIAEYFKVLAEQADYNQRLEAARLKCERAGVTFRYGRDLPEVSAVNAAYACNCGAVVTYHYGDTVPKTHVCRECREKTAEAVNADAELEGRKVPEPPPAPEGVPF